MMKRDDEKPRLVERDPELELEIARVTKMDAAESRWDPWLLALARIEAQREVRVD
jgi:hypothetical protein